MVEPAVVDPDPEVRCRSWKAGTSQDVTAAMI
jgi:hypothetical protein